MIPRKYNPSYIRTLTEEGEGGGERNSTKYSHSKQLGKQVLYWPTTDKWSKRWKRWSPSKNCPIYSGLEPRSKSKMKIISIFPGFFFCADNLFSELLLSQGCLPRRSFNFNNGLSAKKSFTSHSPKRRRWFWGIKS